MVQLLICELVVCCAAADALLRHDLLSLIYIVLYPVLVSRKVLDVQGCCLALGADISDWRSSLLVCQILVLSPTLTFLILRGCRCRGV